MALRSKDEASYRTLVMILLQELRKKGALEMLSSALSGEGGPLEERTERAAAMVDLSHALTWLESLPEELCPDVTPTETLEQVEEYVAAERAKLDAARKANEDKAN